MGMIDRLIGVGGTVTAVGTTAQNVAEIFTQNQPRRMELDEEAYARAMTEHGAEFQTVRPGFFDSLVNGLNRLPRPLLTLGTMSLFAYAMVDPPGFSLRMDGLALIPEPLWWLMGAIVSFYFGAREAHHFRARAWPRATVRQTSVATGDGAAVATEVTARLPDGVGAEAYPAPPSGAAEDFADNAALRDWSATR